MAYASIIAKQSESFIKNLREELHVQVTAEFCAKHNIENPYLTDEEMDALATNNGTEKPLKFGDCPHNIFTSPTSPLTFTGQLIGKDYLDQFKTKDYSGNGRYQHLYIKCGSDVETPMLKRIISQISKIGCHIIYAGFEKQFVIVVSIDKNPENNKRCNMETLRKEYYIEDGFKDKYQDASTICYPKNPPKQTLSRYFLEYERKFPFDYIIAPILVHYDFFLQERLGFLNRKSTEMRISTLYKKTVMHDKAVEKFEKRVIAKELELKEKEQSIDKMIESARQFEEETKKRLEERERMIDMESDLMNRMIIKNKQIEQKYETSRNLVNIKDDLVGICEELLILIKTDERSRELNEIKKKLMRVYSNAVDTSVDIAIATPIANE